MRPLLDGQALRSVTRERAQSVRLGWLDFGVSTFEGIKVTRAECASQTKSCMPRNVTIHNARVPSQLRDAV